MRMILGQKIPAKTLFTKPVSGSNKKEQKEGHIFRSNACKWSKKLLMNFEKFAAKPCRKNLILYISKTKLTVKINFTSLFFLNISNWVIKDLKLSFDSKESIIFL